VYRAHQIGRERTVALKVLVGTAAARPAAVTRFARESALLARLDHPGIVRCLGVGEEDGFHYFATEFVDGPSASTLLRRAGGPLVPAVALGLTRRCAEGLAHASARGIVHRDVKPGNLLVGPGGAVKLTDWGLAKPAGSDTGLTGERTILGTIRYAPPEQFRAARRADRRSDIYALGGTLYELLTGQVPFPGEDWAAVLAAKEAGAFAPASEVNPALPPGPDRVLARMLAPDPTDRYPDYDPLIRDLDAVGPSDAQLDPALLRIPADERPGAPGRPLRVLVVYDAAKYIPLAQHALFAAGVPHELAAVEDGREAPGMVARKLQAGGEFGPDVLVLGLTCPTHTSLRVLDEMRGRPTVLWMSRSPDGAALLRGLNRGIGVWATGFAALEPLSAALRAVYAEVVGEPPATI
jgi:hypothetical protein